jgi:hypothetical protein
MTTFTELQLALDLAYMKQIARETREHLAEMVKPHPGQAEIDKASAELLRKATR